MTAKAEHQQDILIFEFGKFVCLLMEGAQSQLVLNYLRHYHLQKHGNQPPKILDQLFPLGPFKYYVIKIGAAAPRAPTVSKEDSCPQAILKFRPPSSLDYKARHGPQTMYDYLTCLDKSNQLAFQFSVLV